MNNNETQLAVRTQDAAIFRDPSSQMEAVLQMGTWIAKSGMLGCKTIEQGCIISFACLAKGMDPIEFGHTYHLIEGKISMQANTQLAKFRARGGKYKWLNMADDGKCATIRLTYAGETEEISYGMHEAILEGLWDRPRWKKNPGAQLRARVITKGMKIVCPEINALSPEEAYDMDPEPMKVEVVTVPTNDALDNSEVDRLEQLLEPYENAANTFYVSLGAINEGSTYRDLAPDRARRFLAAPAPLLEKLRRIIAAQGEDDAPQVNEAAQAAGGVA